jgi:hypothetical protein
MSSLRPGNARSSSTPTHGSGQDARNRRHPARHTRRGLVVATFAVLAVACAHAYPVSVTRDDATAEALNLGGKPLAARGLKLTFGEARPRPGYHIVRARDDWRMLFPDPREEAITPLPRELDFTQTMVLVASADEAGPKGFVVREVRDDSGQLHVFVTERVRGKDCKPRGTPPIVVALVDRVDGPARFHITTERGKACGDAAPAEVGCRIGQAGDFVPRIAAGPGSTVECVSRRPARSASPILERSFRFAEVPPGSRTKMAFFGEGARVAFPIDGFGSYVVRAELVDESGRTAEADGRVDVAPPDGTMVVELVWTNYQPQDDPALFPRVELEARSTAAMPNGAGEPAGKTGTTGTGYGKLVRLEKRPPPAPTCAPGKETLPPWCRVGVAFERPYLLVDDAEAEKVTLALRYVDERFRDSPIACIRRTRGAAPAELACDDTTRKPDERFVATFAPKPSERDGTDGGADGAPGNAVSVGADAGGPSSAGP